MSDLSIKQLGCCGVIEINWVSSFRDSANVIKAMLKKRQATNWNKAGYSGISGVVIFTGAVSGMEPPRYSERLREFILREGLGEVDRSDPQRNRNTSNNIFV